MFPFLENGSKRHLEARPSPRSTQKTIQTPCSFFKIQLSHSRTNLSDIHPSLSSSRALPHYSKKQCIRRFKQQGCTGLTAQKPDLSSRFAAFLHLYWRCFSTYIFCLVPQLTLIGLAPLLYLLQWNHYGKIKPLGVDQHTFALQDSFLCKEGRPGVIPGSHIVENGTVLCILGGCLVLSCLHSRGATFSMLIGEMNQWRAGLGSSWVARIQFSVSVPD